MDLNRNELEILIRKILAEKLDIAGQGETWGRQTAGKVIKLSLPKINTSGEDRLDTGNDAHQVYTKDLFTLEESPRLGCGLMEMDHTTFDWHLDYDEIDYVIEGELTIHMEHSSVTAGPGEIILIPKGSRIQFSVPGKARFLYVTYPADWNVQK